MASDDYEIEPIDVEHDQLISFISDRNAEDAERASSAGESRQKIGEFLEQTGVASQALSWMRSILKKKKFSQQMDLIRSIEEMLPMVRAHVMGQTTPDMFDKEPQEPVDFKGFEDNAA